MSNLMRSLLLTTLLSFTTPIILVGVLLTIVSGIGYLPGLTDLSQIFASQILEILAVFGSGCPIQGILVIGSAWGMVGCLFELYNFYLYQDLRS